MSVEERYLVRKSSVESYHAERRAETRRRRGKKWTGGGWRGRAGGAEFDDMAQEEQAEAGPPHEERRAGNKDVAEGLSGCRHAVLTWCIHWEHIRSRPCSK